MSLIFNETILSIILTSRYMRYVVGGRNIVIIVIVYLYHTIALESIY